MFCEIRTLRKALMTALNGATKRLFVSVNPQVIKEVASFAELFMATRILAFHYSSDPSCVHMFVSQYLVIRSVGHMLAFAHRVESLSVS